MARPAVAARRALAASIDRATLLDVLTAFLVTRVTLVVVAIVASGMLPLSADIPDEWLRPGLNAVFEAFSRWDSLHYLDIAWNGYRTTDPSSPAFFPLFPIAVRVVGEVTGFADPPGMYAMAVVIANVALFIAALGLVQLARLDLDGATASRSAWYLLVFPTSFFLSAAYGESMFLALSIGAILAGRRRVWWLAGILGGLAALTRPFGILIILPLVMEAWWQRGERPLWRMGLAMVLIPVALTGYMGYLWLQFGDPLAFLSAQSDWDRSLMAPWDTIGLWLDGRLDIHVGPHSIIDFGFMVLAAILAMLSWKLLRRSYAVYVTALVLFPLMTGSLISFPRFVLTFFPMFLVLGILGRWPQADKALVVIGMGIGGLFMALYAQWYWVA